MQMHRNPFQAVFHILVLLALHPAGLGRAADAPSWQLTFTYSDRGLFLVRAQLMPALDKAVRTPGLDGAVLKLDYDLEWQDAQGQILRNLPVVIPLGGRVVLGEGPDNELHPTCIMCEGGFVLRVPGPAEPAQAKRLRLVKRTPRAGLRALDEAQPTEIPKAFDAPEQTFGIPEPTAGPAAAPGPLAVTKVRSSGSDGNRLVIVFMGDGFTSANLAAGTFANKVTSFLNTMLGVSPWNLYASLVNAYRIDVISNEQGADYEDASPSAGGTLKDTYLNAAFWVGNTERCLFLTGDGASKAFAAADDFVGAGVWDEILVFVNSTKYGGCGGSVGVSSLTSSSDEVQIHEFGHSFAGVADEYDYGSTSTNCNPTSAPNADCSNTFPHVKWDAWVTPGTPIPTPDTAPYDSAVGAFEGAVYQTRGMFRPKRNCKMRNLGAAFCPVCQEAHILKLFQQMRIVDAASPPLGEADVPAYGARTFTVTPVNVSRFSYQWWLLGAPLPDATNATVTVAASQVPGTNVELRLEVTHVTTNVRAQPIVQTNLWRLRPADLPAISIADASLVEGDAGSNSLRFTVALSFPHNQPVSVAYATADGTARAGQDYVAATGRLTFAPGQFTNTLDVTVLGDVGVEPNEMFFVNLTDPTNAVLGRRQAGGLIRDDDHAPSVTIASPLGGAVFFAPASVRITANAFDFDGRITNVAFYAGGSRLGEAIVQPYAVTWSNVAAGAHALTAVALDNSARRATSAPVHLTVIAGSTQQVALIDITGLWKYDASTNDYGTAWKEPAYDDAAWLGPSDALFFNETASLPAPKNTFLPLTNASGARLRSYYFRTHFDWPSNQTGGIVLVSSNLVDDGAVFWLNGVDVGRLRMPAGAVSRTTLATSTPPNNGDATAYEVLTLPTSALRPGDNVMAVEVHQQSDTSSDVVFGMSLQALPGTPPFILDPSQPPDMAVLQNRPVTLSVIATSAPPPTYQWFRNGTPMANATNATYTIASMTSGAAGSYSARVTNFVGFADSRAAELSYLADTVPPTLVYALGSNNPTRILVSFSEALHPASATPLANYRVSPIEGGTNLVILLASVLNSSNVLLTTSARATNLNYLLTVNAVRDLYSNAIAPDSQIALATEVVLAGDSQTWRYFQSESDPGAGWMAPGYDDGAPSWKSGAALFDAKRPPRSALGTTAVQTQLNLTNPPTATDQTLSYYFRTTFRLGGPAAGTRLRLRPLVDDGAVFYVNGQEVHRLRMPALPEPISYATLATDQIGDGAWEGPIELPTDALVSGQNTLAVEVHQGSATSSDVSFAAELVAELPAVYAGLPRLTIAPAANGVFILWDRADAILQDAPSAQGPWNDMVPAAASPFYVSPLGASRFYRARVP